MRKKILTEGNIFQESIVHPSKKGMASLTFFEEVF